MTDKQPVARTPDDGAKLPVQPATPGVAAEQPGQPVPAPKEDPYGEARLLRAQADAIEAAAPPTDEYVRLKVEPPHESFSYGGVTVGTAWTAVHRSLAPAVLSAAADAPGVTVTQEGQ